MDRFRRMEIFVAVVEEGQLTRAAQALYLSKSAVSHALTDLEKYLGLQLLVRNNRRWQLTDAGYEYFEQCKTILNDVQNMEDKARAKHNDLSGLIRLSAPDTFASYTLVPVLSRFMDKHPNISIDLTLTERVVDLIEDRIDVSFRTGAFKPSSRLVAHKIGEAQTMLCASPDYLEKYGTPSSHLDFKNHKCLCYARNPKWRLQKDGRWYEYMPNGHIVTNSGETIREFCIRGQGIAFMSSMLAEFAVKKGRLVQIMPDYTCEKMPVNAIRVGDHRSTTRVIKLLEFVVAELQSRQRDIAELV